MHATNPKWINNQTLLSRLAAVGRLEERDGMAYLHGRPLIMSGADSSDAYHINGSIWADPMCNFGPPYTPVPFTERESVVVEESNELRLLKGRVYRSVLNCKAQDRGTILREVGRTVQDSMPEGFNYWIDLVRILNAEGDVPVHIDTFIDAGVGICNHKGLAAASLVETMIEEGHLTGSVSYDSNAAMIDGRWAGHGWARHTSDEGIVTVLDPSQSYVGPVMREGFLHWPYARPTDPEFELQEATSQEALQQAEAERRILEEGIEKELGIG